MSDPIIRERVFLDGQNLSALIDCPVENREFHVCGGTAGIQVKQPDAKDPWQVISREMISSQARGPNPLNRVALVCDAGRGKTTNISWLKWQLAQTESQQLAFFISLASTDELALLSNRDELLKWMAERLRDASGKRFTDDQYRDVIYRLQSNGRCTFLIDGLDHAISESLVTRLQNLMACEEWRRCHFWIAGRPYAFKQAWNLFAGKEWEFFRVEPLAESEIRKYLTQTAGGDWYDLIPDRGRELLANPRLLRLMSGILLGVIREADRHGQDRKAAIDKLDLRSGADVYEKAYFTPGKYPEVFVPGQDDTPRGLLASGVLNRTTTGDWGGPAYIGLKPNQKPREGNFCQRIERTAAMLGAIAFEMFAQNTIQPDPKNPIPHPNLVGIVPKDLPAFMDAIQQRLKRTDPNGELSFEDDWERLGEMNNQAVDFLLFKDLSARGIAWHDPTVLAFFAAHWLTRYGNAMDRKHANQWIVIRTQSDTPERLKAFSEFWEFAAAMPYSLAVSSKWLAVFDQCYAPERTKADLPYSHLQWTREMIYHSLRNLRRRAEKGEDDDPYVILWNGWREKWLALKGGEGSPDELKYYQEIVGGFMPCPPGDPMTCRVLLHEFTVTNGQYELFEPFHERAKKISDQADQPVVNVSFWDSYCCAVWMGCRLPTSEEWEFACGAGSTAEYSFGNGSMNNGTQANCDGNFPDESDQKGPYLERTVSLAEVALEFEGHKIRYEQNAWGLWHMHGNVWEWCNAKYDNDSYIVRGGSWDYLASNCRASDHLRSAPDYRVHDTGLRLACLDFC